MDEPPTLDGAGTRALKMIGGAIVAILGIAVAIWWKLHLEVTNLPGGADCKNNHQCASNVCTRGACGNSSTYGDSKPGYPCSFDTDCKSKRCTAQICD